jgi:hypothetical protein
MRIANVSQRAPLPWYPVVVAVAMVLAAFVDADVNIAALWRPLAIVVVVTLVIQLGLSAALRQSHRAAVVTVALLVLVRAGDLLHVVVGLLLVAVSVSAFVVFARIRRRRPNTAMVTRPANTIGTILLVGVVGTGAVNGAIARAVADLSLGTPSTSAARASTAPNIYIVLLDGYPRVDTFKRLFDYDNSAFLDHLSDLGFSVATRSRSNYMYTQLTLSSMFQMRHLDELLERQPSTRMLIADNPVFEQLRARGYRIVTNATPWEGVTLRAADTVCADGDVTEFEFLLMRSSLILPATLAMDPAFLADRHRRHVEAAFTCLGQARASGTPQFVYTHVPSPHVPIVFEADGSPAPLDVYGDTAQELGLSDAEYAQVYVGQIAYLNRRVIETVDQLVVADPDAIIIVMSDHGSESHLDWTDARRSDLNERFSNLFAARTPGKTCVFGNAPTPVNLFPTLLNAYLGTDFPLQPDATYISDPGAKLTLEKVPNPDAEAINC